MKPADDIGAFAALCARLDDPFAERDSVLRAAGLSIAEWGRIKETWQQRLGAGGEAAALGRAFGAAYAAAKATIAGPTPHFRPVTADFALPVKAALPFNPNAPSSLPEPEARPPEQKGFSSGTADIDVAGIMRRSLPFGAEAPRAPGRPARPAAPELTLDQYASLCAAIAVFPQRADALFQQYGLSSQEDRPSVDRTWRERLRRDPALYKDWSERYKRYQEHWTLQARREAKG